MAPKAGMPLAKKRKKHRLMKKIVLLAGLAFSLCTSFKSEAQVRVNIQIGAPVVQQSWYNNDDDYYFMPDQGVYYNVRRRVYVFPQGGSWVYASHLPSRYGNVSYSNSRYYRVRERAPFNRDDYYRRRYAIAYNGHRGNNNMRDNDRRNDNNRGWGRNGIGESQARNNDRNNNGNSVHYNRR
jgi:hypothetical protein